MWRTAAWGAVLGKLSNVSRSGSKRTIAFAAKSVSQILSFSSTHTEYACGLAPGSFHARHALPDAASVGS